MSSLWQRFKELIALPKHEEKPQPLLKQVVMICLGMLVLAVASSFTNGVLTDMETALSATPTATATAGATATPLLTPAASPPTR